MIGRRIQYEIAGRVVGPLAIAIDRWRHRQRRRKKRSGRNPLGPPLESSQKLKELMSLHYLQGRYADGAVPVAWVTSGFPVEILRPFAFHVVYPENHAALCGARRMVPELAQVAEAEGFSRDLCGYARADIGSLLSQKTPVGRLPKPDLLCCCTNICQTVLYWYRHLAAIWRVPLVVIDTPFVYTEAEEHEIAYVQRQLENLIEVAGRVSGRRPKSGQLSEVMRLAKEGSELWGACLKTASHRPSPWTGFDGFVHMAPIVAMRGTETCNAYYRMLKDELDDRIQRGIGGIADEQFRLLWDNLPIWYKMRELATVFAEQGFNFVCATYTNAWAEPVVYFDPSDPVRSTAQAYTNVLLNRGVPHRLQVMAQLIEAYHVDGVVLHSDRSCKPYSIGQIDLKRELADVQGVRAMILDADHADPRVFSEEQVMSRVQAFMESFT